MAEHQLAEGTRVIGIAFDGTGLGTDGAIWGGEVLIADYSTFERAVHLRYFPLPGGDAAIKYPARVALGLLWSLGLAWDPELAPVQDMDPAGLDALRQQLERKVNVPLDLQHGKIV